MEIAALYVYHGELDLLRHHLSSSFNGCIGLLNEVLVIDTSPSSENLYQEISDLLSQDVYQKLRIFHIDKYKPWNQPTANNIGFFEARSEIVIRLDIDMILTTSIFDSLSSFPLGQTSILKFQRTKLKLCGDMTLGSPHPNCFAIHKNHYYSIGGYDDRFSGNWGYDDIEFFYRARSKKAQLHLSDAALIEKLHNNHDNFSSHYHRRMLSSNMLLCNFFCKLRKLGLGIEPRKSSISYSRVL